MWEKTTQNKGIKHLDTLATIGLTLLILLALPFCLVIFGLTDLFYRIKGE